jgi:hypothetical protein
MRAPGLYAVTEGRDVSDEPMRTVCTPKAYTMAGINASLAPTTPCGRVWNVQRLVHLHRHGRNNDSELFPVYMYEQWHRPNVA